MLLQIASDLHLEALPATPKGGDWSQLIQPSAPYLALLGDICETTTKNRMRRLVSFLKWCCQRFRKVLYVLGNHEFYNRHERCLRTISDTKQRLQRLESWFHPTLVVMDRMSLAVEGVRILGTTLWSALPTEEARAVAKDGISDYQRIFEDVRGDCCRRLRPETVHAMHMEERAWLESELTLANERQEGIIVLTHHAPSFVGTANPMYGGAPNFETGKDLRNCAFASHLDDIVQQCDVWAFGHTHFSTREQRGRALLVANQRGHEDEPTGFQRDFVIEIASSTPARNDADASGDDDGVYLSSEERFSFDCADAS